MDAVTSTTGPSFEASLEELEQLVRDLEDGRLGLEDSLGRYERGVHLIKHCLGRLQQAEQRILVLTAVDGETARPILQPFEHAATGGDNSRVPVRRAPRRRPEEPEIPF